MKEIVVNVNPFVLIQNVFIRENGEVKNIQVPQKDLANFISLEPNLKVVYLFGNEKIVKKIKEECFTKYNVSDIEFKIN